MTTIVILGLPIVLGLLVRNRMAAYVSYLGAYSFLFTLQSIWLVVKWAGGSTNAFGPFPKANMDDMYSYGAVNAVLLAVALGLLTGCYQLASRRRARAVASAHAPAPATARS